MCHLGQGWILCLRPLSRELLNMPWERPGMEWFVDGVKHWIDAGGEVPALVHEKPDGGVGRGWHSPPSTQQLKLFRQKLLRHGIEVYMG